MGQRQSLFATVSPSRGSITLPLEVRRRHRLDEPGARGTRNALTSSPGAVGVALWSRLEVSWPNSSRPRTPKLPGSCTRCAPLGEQTRSLDLVHP